MSKPKICKHRHTPETHPNCFNKVWYKEDGQRVGYLDVEATGLDAASNWLLSWAIKERKGSIISDYVRGDEVWLDHGIVNREFDKRLVKALLNELNRYTCIVTYYGTGFDIPFVRSLAMKYNLKFPPFGKIAHIDLYFQVRSRMKLYKNSLAVSTEFLGIHGKTHLDFDYWKLASMGDVAAMEELLRHNERDVIILEKLHRQLEPYGKFTRKSL